MLKHAVKLYVRFDIWNTCSNIAVASILSLLSNPVTSRISLRQAGLHNVHATLHSQVCQYVRVHLCTLNCTCIYFAMTKKVHHRYSNRRLNAKFCGQFREREHNFSMFCLFVKSTVPTINMFDLERASQIFIFLFCFMRPAYAVKLLNIQRHC